MDSHGVLLGLGLALVKNNFLLLRRGQQSLLFEHFLQLLAGDDRATRAVVAVAAVQFCLGRHRVVDVACATHAVLTGILAPNLRLHTSHEAQARTTALTRRRDYCSPILMA